MKRILALLLILPPAIYAGVVVSELTVEGQCTIVATCYTDPSEQPTEPPAEPEQPSEPPLVIEPVLPGDPEARFDVLAASPNTIAAASFSSQEEINAWHKLSTVRNGEEPPKILYDPEKNAATAVIVGDGIPSADQVRVGWPTMDHTNASIVSLQWDFMLSAGYETYPPNGFKLYQIANASDKLMFEFYTKFRQPGGIAAIPFYRYYGDLTRSEAIDDVPLGSYGPPISNVTGMPIDNWQPGGDTALDYAQQPTSPADHLNPELHRPYVLVANKWYRKTVEFRYGGGELRVCGWLQAEDEEVASQIIGGVEDPSKCFRLVDDTSVYDPQIGFWWIEVNGGSMDAHVQDPPLYVWTKNLVVWKDASIPLN